MWNGTAWANDNRTFFYMTADAAKRGDTVWRHVLGTPREKDAKIFHEPDVLFNVGVGRMRSDEYIAIRAGSFTSGEYRVIPTANPTAEPRLIAARRPGIEFDLEHGNGWFYMVTNEGAKNFRIRRAADKPGTLEWTDWAPHSADVFIENFDVFDTFAVVMERRKGLRQLRVVNLADNASHDVTFDESAYGVFPSGNAEFKTATFRFSYSSPVTPSTVFDYNPSTRQRVVHEAAGDPQRLRQDEVRGAPRHGARARRRLGARLDSHAEGRAARRQPAAAALRVRLVRRHHRAHVQLIGLQPRRSRDDLRHRARPRRPGDGPAVVRRREDAEEEEHVLRLRRRRGVPGQVAATPNPIVSSPTAAAPAGC